MPDEDVLDAELGRALHPFTRKPGNLNRLREQLLDIMWDEVGVVRDHAGLERGIAALDAIEAELLTTGLADDGRAFNMTWHDWLNLRSLTEISRVIALAARKRENSRGAHFRSDFPEPGDLATSRFDPELDYAKYLDGRPRFDATRDVLTACGITLPFGEPGDPAGTATVCALANAKNVEFLRLVRIEGVKPFRSTMKLLRMLREASVPTALVSSSMDCDTVTHAAGVADAFDVRLSGVDIRALGLPGKPHPGGFLEGARRLGVAPADSVVLEDARRRGRSRQARRIRTCDRNRSQGKRRGLGPLRRCRCPGCR